MKRKLMIFSLVALIFSSFNFGSASAAGFSANNLSLGEKTATTSRVTLKSGEKLRFYVEESQGSMVFVVFKNGSYYQGYAADGRTSGVVTGAGPGEYSLRVYCGNPNDLKTNCSSPLFYLDAY